MLMKIPFLHGALLASNVDCLIAKYFGFETTLCNRKSYKYTQRGEADLIGVTSIGNNFVSLCIILSREGNVACNERGYSCNQNVHKIYGD